MGFSKELVSAGLRLWGAKAPGFGNVDYESGKTADPLMDIIQTKITAKPKKNSPPAMPDFDAADLMESGLVRAPWVLQQPESTVAPRRQMRVQRSKNKLEHTLYDEDGRIALVAHTIEAENQVNIFAARDDTKKAQPVFTLTFDESTTEWQLDSNCCESDVYRSYKTPMPPRAGGKTLMRASQMKEKIGLGVALVMDVDVPEVSEQSGRSTWSPLPCDAEPQCVLTSKRPVWSRKLQSLTMDFNGRVKCASAKNVQLLMGDDLKLVFGKVKPGNFILDFEHPLSVAQAFAIGLTTMFWD